MYMCTAPFSDCLLPQLIGLARPTFLISCLVFQLFLREVQCNPNCLSGYLCLGATFYDVPFTHKPVTRHQLETLCRDGRTKNMADLSAIGCIYKRSVGSWMLKTSHFPPAAIAKLIHSQVHHNR